MTDQTSWNESCGHLDQYIRLKDGTVDGVLESVPKSACAYCRIDKMGMDLNLAKSVLSIAQNALQHPDDRDRREAALFQISSQLRPAMDASRG